MNDDAMVNRKVFAFKQFPCINTPFTSLMEGWLTHQSSNCKEMELDWARCASQVGLRRSHVDCQKYYEDLHECVTRTKHKLRYQEMQKEHKKKGTVKDPPPKDSLRMYHLDDLDRTS